MGGGGKELRKEVKVRNVIEKKWSSEQIHNIASKCDSPAGVRPAVPKSSSLYAT